jgi:hypothetical protein
VMLISTNVTTNCLSRRLNTLYVDLIVFRENSHTLKIDNYLKNTKYYQLPNNSTILSKFFLKSFNLMSDIDYLVSEFKKQIDQRVTQKTTSTFCTDFKTVVSLFLERQTNGKKVKGKKDEVDKKLNTWARIWVSTKYGGKTRFPQDYQKIKEEAEESGDKKTSFQILSKLRTLLETEEDRVRWNGWYEWVQSENTGAPEEPPSDRQPTKEVKKKPITRKPMVKKATVKKSDDDELEADDSPVKSNVNNRRLQTKKKVEKPTGTGNTSSRTGDEVSEKTKDAEVSEKTKDAEVSEKTKDAEASDSDTDLDTPDY